MAIASSVFGHLQIGDKDRDLVEAHRAGDLLAFAEIVRTYYPELLMSARRRLGNSADAEDAVQESLLRAFRGLDRFGESGEWRLGAWLTRILTNVCTDAGLSRQAATRLSDRLAVTSPTTDRDVAELASDPVALQAVREALSTLPTGQRSAFVLRVVDDLPYPEVAEQLGITEDNARTRVKRARAALRDVLDRGGAIAGSLAVAPTVLSGTLRRVARQILSSGLVRVGLSARVATRSLPADPGSHGQLASAASTGSPAGGAMATIGVTAPSIGSSVATAASSAAGSVTAAVNGPLGSGVNLIGQLAATPVGQMALAASSAPGRGSMVLGLAASLATAGALSLPASSLHAAPPVHAAAVGFAPASSDVASSTSPANSPGTPAVAPRTGSGPSGSSGSGTESDVGSGSGGNTGTSGAASPGSASAIGGSSSNATTPTWVALAATAGVGHSTAGGSDKAGSGTGEASGSASSAPVSQAPAAQSSASSEAGSPTVASSGATTSSSGSASSTGSGPTSSGASGSGGSAVTGATNGAGGPANTSSTGPATSGSSVSPANGVPLPAGTCSGVPGFPGITVPTSPPALSSADLVAIADTGTDRLISLGGGPALQGDAALSQGPNTAKTPLTVIAGSCLGQGGSLLAVDLTGSDGQKVQLVGSLVGDPTMTAPGGGPTSPGQPSDTTYFFRGTVRELDGVFPEDGALPWGISTDFVAQLQVMEPSDSADLTIAFLQPSGSTSAASSTASSGGTG